MSALYETQPTSLQLALAVRTKRPAGLAQTFASHAGQFYDRIAFDTLARQVSDLYSQSSPDDAHTFRNRLDRRLCDRHHDPVAWDLAGTTQCEARPGRTPVVTAPRGQGTRAA
jgi:hypothetical protein